MNAPQITNNPEMMQNMLSAPYTQSMMQAMSQNPDMAANIVSSNPLFAGNPQMQEQMRNMMPQFMQQLQNPAVQSMMTNPEALAAINQIQQGLQRLQAASPELYRLVLQSESELRMRVCKLSASPLVYCNSPAWKARSEAVGQLPLLPPSWYIHAQHCLKKTCNLKPIYDNNMFAGRWGCRRLAPA